MKKSILYIVVLTFLISNYPVSFGFNMLDFCHNGYRSGDSVVKKEVTFIEPQSRGTNCTWVVPDYNITNEYIIRYHSDTTNIFGDEPHTRFRYYQNTDSLSLCGFENRCTHFTYYNPIVQITWPYTINDSISSIFYGNGIYSDKMYIEMMGRCTSVADGIGRMIIESDTLNDIIRVHRHVDKIRNFSSTPYISGCRSKEYIDSVLTYISDYITEDYYIWYRAGYRYPVCESIFIKNIAGSSVHDIMSTSFLYLPADQEYDLCEDKENSRVREMLAAGPHYNWFGSGGETKIENTGNLPITFTTRANTEGIDITYSTTNKGNIIFMAADIAGNLLGSIINKGESDTNNVHIDFSSPVIGNVVILYIEVDGDIASYKISL